ncbi:MAG: crossover junction endodeoxyribonuclease RuvC [Chloroflexota bacterium]|nr:crossover junction endodeoxyribonuclease RuvC [Chloroflexota bacterium]
MRVLGLDPGLATTGWGMVEEVSGELTLVDFGVITTDPSEPLVKRLRALYQELKALLALQQPDEAAVEELFFCRNVRTALLVGQARGVALLALADEGLEVHEYTPLQVKQAVVGYGQATKHQVQQMTQMLLGLSESPQPDDAADAVAVAICYLHSARFQELIARLPAQAGEGER